MNIAETRQAIADVLNAAFPDFDVKPYAESNSLTTGDGYVSLLGPTTPLDFSSCAAVFAVTLIMGMDAISATQLSDVMVVQTIDVLTKELYSSDVSVVTGREEDSAGKAYLLRATLTMEVEK